MGFPGVFDRSRTGNPLHHNAQQPHELLTFSDNAVHLHEDELEA